MKITIVFGRPMTGKTTFLINEFNKNPGVFLSFESDKAYLISQGLNFPEKVIDYRAFTIEALSEVSKSIISSVVCIDSFEHIPQGVSFPQIYEKLNQAHDINLFISSHLRRDMGRNTHITDFCQNLTANFIELKSHSGMGELPRL